MLAGFNGAVARTHTHTGMETDTLSLSNVYKTVNWERVR